MNFLQKWILGKELMSQLEQKAAIFPMNTKLMIDNGRIISPMDNKSDYVKNGYSINDVIYSVINLILNKVKLPEWSIYKIVNESSLKKANRLLSVNNLDTKKRKEALQLKEDSLDEVTKFDLQTGKLNDLLEYPNDIDTFQDLVVKAILFKLLTGDQYLWAELLDGGANQGIPNSLWNLPSQFMTIKITDQFPARPAAYELFSWNQRFTIQEVLHEAMPNPNFSINGEELYGFAPLRAFCKNTIRNNSAKDASTAKFQNGGLEEIVYFDDDKVGQDPKFAHAQMQALKLKLAEEYSGPNAQGKKAFTGYKVGSVSLGLSPVDLGIIDSEKWDAIMFCNGYNVPPELLGLTNKTYNNVVEAQKALIQGAAMPHLDTFRRCFNRKLQSDWGFKGKNIYVDYTTDPFPELEADVSKTMDWMSKVTAVKPNEERIAVGLDADPDPLMDELWILSTSGTRVPLTDFKASEVDQILNGNNQAQGTGNNNQQPVNGQGDKPNGNADVPKNGFRKAGLSNRNGVQKINA